MFRRANRQPVKIDPTNLSEAGQIHLDELIRHWLDKSIFQKDICYSLPDIQKSTRKNIEFKQFLLTHTLMRGQHDGKAYYEVVRDVVMETEDILRYTLVGRLDFFDGRWNLSHDETAVCFRYKSSIDPLNMSPSQNNMLGIFLQDACYSQNAIRYFYKGFNTYRFVDLNQQVVFVHLDLKNAIVAREREKYPEQFRFEVVGSKLGSGGFASVFHVSTTLIPLSSGGLLLKKSNRVIKRQLHKKDDLGFDLSNEYLNSRRINHMHVKRPVHEVSKLESTGFMTIDYLPGESLLNILLQESQKLIYSIEQRFRISIALIRALHEQVHQKNIVHRDVKPANVILNLDKPYYPKVYCIDMGLSKSSHMSDPGVSCGTINYASPEIYASKNTTFSTDVYSLSNVLAELWWIRGDEELRLPNSQILSKRLSAFYGGEGGLTKVQCDLLAGAISKMHDESPLKRSNLLDALREFDQIRFQYSLSKAGNMRQKELSNARSLATRLRGDIEQCQIKQVFDKHMDNIAQAIIRVLPELTDHPAVIDEFIYSLDVMALEGLASREAIHDRMLSINANYAFLCAERSSVVIALGKIIDQPAFKFLHQDYQLYLRQLHLAVLSRNKSEPASFDDAVCIMHKAEADIKLIRSEISEIKTLQQGNRLGASMVRSSVIGRPSVGLCSIVPEKYKGVILMDSGGSKSALKRKFGLRK